jgi:demethylmenaquinone methyltransferase/2-methoxy-6-polyprenyl-1,4-benzoquinol methylase
VLEFTTPPRQPLRAMYLLYFRVILPWVGRLISRHRSAYAYLPATVLGFPGPGELASRIESAGFKGVRWELLSGGIAALHVAVRH